jgi:hypothetical protein
MAPIAKGSGDVGTKQGGAEAMRQLLSLDPRPDGLFCFNGKSVFSPTVAQFSKTIPLAWKSPCNAAGKILRIKV